MHFRGQPPDDIEPIEQTRTIPCVIGERFGAYFGLERRTGFAGREQFSVRWSHPNIDDPEGFVERTRTEYPAFWDIPRKGVLLVFVGWALDGGPDLVEGPWNVELLHRGDILVSQPFDVLGCP